MINFRLYPLWSPGMGGKHHLRGKPDGPAAGLLHDGLQYRSHGPLHSRCPIRWGEEAFGGFWSIMLIEFNIDTLIF